MEKQHKNHKRFFVYFVCFIGSLGGLLFGLDIGFMNGALKDIISDMHLTVEQGSSFAAVMLLGCLIGSLVSGYISKRFGRKNILVSTALIFTVFSILSSLAGSIEALTIYRFILGLSVGVASFAVPLYLSEIAPTKFRGGFVAMYQMMITVGIFLIFITDYLINRDLGNWRPMFYALTIPALIMLMGTFFIPKSPRWLFMKHSEAKAQAVLEKTLKYEDEVEFEMCEMRTAAEDEAKFKNGNFFSMLRQSFFLRVLFLGILIQMFQQLTGINSVIYYSTSIFQAAGMQSAPLATIIVGLVNMLTTIIAVLCLDKLGRKPIMYFGYTLMLLALMTIAYVFKVQANGGGINEAMQMSLAVATVVFIFAFAISAGPIAWVLCAEIFPMKGRELGLTVTTASNWIIAYLVVQFSLPMMTLANGKPNFEGGAALFFGFAMCCLIFLFIIKFFIPETKNVSLEEIEENLLHGKKLKDLGTLKDLPPSMQH